MNSNWTAKITILKQQQKSIRYWLFENTIDRLWLTGFSASVGLIIVDTKTGTIKVFFDPRYLTEVKKTLKNCQFYEYNQFEQYWNQIYGSVAISHETPVWIYTGLKKNQNCQLILTDFSVCRMIKTSSEIKAIGKACQLTAQVWEKIKNNLPNFQNEQDVASFIKQQFLKENCDISFTPIVASAERSSFIHTQASNQKINKILLCDFGAKYANYCADFTRTLILTDDQIWKQRQATIQKIYQSILKELKPGAKISEIIKLIHQLFQQQNWKLEHALGHGIGLKVHEAPTLHIKSRVLLQENMVLAIEPGIYFKNSGGIRHEDTILITKTGYKILTTI